MADRRLQERIDILTMAEAQGKPLRPEHQAELKRYRDMGLAKSGPTSGGGGDTTEGERKASAFLVRALGSNKSYEAQNIGPRSMIGQAVADRAPSFLNTLPSVIGNSPERQVADSSQDEFIAASLRQDSGAAIPPEEMERQRRIYFPMPGDGEAVLKQKREARRRALEGLVNSAGGAITPAIKADFDAYLKSFDQQPAQAAQEPADRVEDPRKMVGVATKIQQEIGAPGPDEGLKVDVYEDTPENRAKYEALTPAQRTLLENGFSYDEAKGYDPNSLGNSANAVQNGLADTLTFGFRDELQAAGDTLFKGGTFEEQLRRQRALDTVDEEENPWLRIGGQVAGGLAIPVGAGATTAGQFARVGALSGGAYGFGSGDSLRDRFTVAGTNALAGAGLGYVGAKAAPRIENALARFMGPSPARTASSATMEAADKLNIDLLPADVGGATTRLATGAFGRSLGGGSISTAAERSIQQSGQARDRIAAGIGNATDATGAGQAAQRGARAWLGRSEQRAEQLYQAIPVPAQMPAELVNTRGALAEITQGFQSNPALSKLWAENPRLKATLRALTPNQNGQGGLSWEDLKRFRSIVGEIAGKPSVADDGNTIQAMKKLYGALSEDMRATAAKSGPQALQAFNRANQFWRGREDRIEQVLTGILGRDYQKGEADAFGQLNRWAQAQGGDFKRLAGAMRSLPKDEADTVRASLLGRMGNARPGNGGEAVFSSAEFVTQWNKLDNRAKSVLFPNAEQRKSIDALVRVTGAQKRAGQFANQSNTGAVVSGVGTLGTLINEPISGLALLTSQYAAGKLLSSPAFARWLARPPRSAGQAQAWARGLRSIATRNPALAAEIGQFEQSLIRAVANDNAATVGRAAASDGTDPNRRQDRQPGQ